jgi:hypothetical protein
MIKKISKRRLSQIHTCIYKLLECPHWAKTNTEIQTTVFPNKKSPPRYTGLYIMLLLVHVCDLWSVR